MISMFVAGGSECDEVKPRRIDDSLYHTNMRRQSARIFYRERVGEIWIDESKCSIPAKKISTLAKPPESKLIFSRIPRLHVGDKRIILDDGFATSHLQIAAFKVAHIHQ